MQGPYLTLMVERPTISQVLRSLANTSAEKHVPWLGKLHCATSYIY